MSMPGLAMVENLVARQRSRWRLNKASLEGAAAAGGARRKRRTPACLTRRLRSSMDTSARNYRAWVIHRMESNLAELVPQSAYPLNEQALNERV